MSLHTQKDHQRETAFLCLHITLHHFSLCKSWLFSCSYIFWIFPTRPIYLPCLRCKLFNTSFQLVLDKEFCEHKFPFSREMSNRAFKMEVDRHPTYTGTSRTLAFYTGPGKASETIEESTIKIKRLKWCSPWETERKVFQLQEKTQVKVTRALDAQCTGAGFDDKMNTISWYNLNGNKKKGSWW